MLLKIADALFRPAPNRYLTNADQDCWHLMASGNKLVPVPTVFKFADVLCRQEQTITYPNFGLGC